MGNADDKSVGELLDQLRERLDQQQAEMTDAFAALGGDVDRLIQQFSRVPQAVPAAAPQPLPVAIPATPQRPPARPGALDFLQEPSDQGSFDLQSIVFGPAIAANVSLEPRRGELIRDLTSGDAAAMTLCGAIMLFRGANTERMPQLLKDIGEAWYAWSPHTADEDDDLRDSLCRWLERTCAEASVPNTIELVRPGDRFDVKRHHARQPGVEVTQVAGWVVLRDNGKVYTKANVSVK